MFRLNQLKLSNHPILGEIDLYLCDKEFENNSTYQTVIIGPNGTGKSNILQVIINIFRECAHYIMNGDRNPIVGGAYYLKYFNGGREIEIMTPAYLKIHTDDFTDLEKSSEAIFFLDNRKPSKDIDLLPNKLLASSMIFTDKFPAVEDKHFPQYNYLGVRNIKSPSSAGTRIINRKVTEALQKSFSTPSMFALIQEVLQDLDYSPTIRISYKPKYRSTFYNKGLTVADLVNLFENWQTTFQSRKTAPWGMPHYINIRNDRKLLERIVKFLDSAEFRSFGKGGKVLEFILSDQTSTAADHEVIRHLQSLDLLTYPTIQIVKRGQDFDFSGSSSGEQNILFTLLMLLANIQNRSLVLIDEPELSLHPNWQMQFFHLLRKVFKKLPDVHVIAATHSHFMISDLQGKDSKIVSLIRNEKGVTQISYPAQLDTFGWSSEDVLYNIFNVRSSLNYYLEADLTELLGMIGQNSQNQERIWYILEKLRRLPVREHDPLQEIIKEAEDYLISIS